MTKTSKKLYFGELVRIEKKKTEVNSY